MFTFPTKSLQAVEAVVYIAGSSGTATVSSKEISDYLGLPPRHLELIMQRLVHAGILRGVRGPRGGYLLARERRRITVADICEALAEDGEILNTPLSERLLLPMAREAEDKALEFLRGVTLAELGARAAVIKPPRMAKRAGGRMDFNI